MAAPGVSQGSPAGLLSWETTVLQLVMVFDHRVPLTRPSGGRCGRPLDFKARGSDVEGITWGADW